MRDIFRKAFAGVELPYFNPHSFRKTLMALAYELELSGEDIKAWSQNLGHEKLDTSVNSYGNLSDDRHRARMLAMHEKPKAADDDNRPATLAEIKALLASREEGRGGVNGLNLSLPLCYNKASL